MKIALKIWRQKNHSDKGSFKDYKLDHVSPDMSFLEMLDLVSDKDAAVYKYYRHLRQFAKLRNAIVHTHAGRGDTYVAYPLEVRRRKIPHPGG